MQNNYNKLLESILFDSYEINNIIKNNDIYLDLDFINSFWFEIFYDLLENNENFKNKINDISKITNINFNNKIDLITFLNSKSIKNMINSIKYLTIIFWLDKFLTISDKLPINKSLFLKKIKILDFYLKKNFETDEYNFKMKFMILSNKWRNIDIITKMIQKKSYIYKDAINNNPSKLENIKMSINTRKINYIKKIEEFEET